MHFNFNIISVVLVTGGLGDTESVKKSVELLSINGTKLCSLPDLPAERFYHSQSGLLTCGGGPTGTDAKTTCLTFAGGRWKKSHTLGKPRHDHSAWALPNGVLLIGGPRTTGDGLSATTTELLTDNGVSTPSFSLQNKI